MCELHHVRPTCVTRADVHILPLERSGRIDGRHQPPIHIHTDVPPVDIPGVSQDELRPAERE